MNKPEEDELIFETENGEVHYSFEKDYVNLELIQSASIGEGCGTKLMKEFIQFIKEKNINEVHLFAHYDPFYYDDEQDSIVGIERLVKFYELFGFETLQRPYFFEGCQINMALYLVSDNYPLNDTKPVICTL